MVLEEFTQKRAEKVNLLTLPKITLPYPIKIVWFNVMNSKTSNIGIFPSHHKHSFFEIHFLLDGSVTYTTKSMKYTLKSGELVLFSPKKEHIYIDESSDFLKASITFEIDSECILYKKLSELDECRLNFGKKIADCIDCILKEVETDSPFSKQIIQGRVLEMIYEIVKIANIQLPKVSLDQKDTDPRFLVAKDYIVNNIAKLPSCDEVAAVVELSTKHLNRIFVKHTGSSLFSYITEVRLKRAEDLLVNTRLSIKEISEMLGFESEYSFNSFFKKHIGMPPGFYRKNN